MYMHDWATSQREGMMTDFYIDEAALEGAEILFATYTYEDYSGSAHVLFRREGKFFEVVGGHCSCYGLEEQWDPEEVTIEFLLQRIDSYPDYYEEATAEIVEILIKLRAE